MIEHEGGQPGQPSQSGPESSVDYGSLLAEARPELRGFLELADDLPNFPLGGSKSERRDYYRESKDLTNLYGEVFEEDREGVAVLSELTSFMQTSRSMDNPDISHEQKLERVKALTEYQFLVTHFAAQNTDKPEFMQDFWRAAEQVAAKSGNADRLERYKEGILTAVATYKIFQALGKQPTLSHPREDAFDSIDLWFDDLHAVQIKKHNSNRVEVYKTDVVDFPAVQVDGPDQTRVYSADSQSPFGKFRTKIERYSQRTHKSVEGFFVKLPYGMIDHDTGVPSAELVAEIKRQVEA